MSWQIKLWGGVSLSLSRKQVNQWARLTYPDKPLFSKSNGGFPLASKVSFPMFARAKQEASVDSREQQKRGEGCRFETCFQRTANASVVMPCSPLTVSLQ